jgi:hypothetical protein
VHECYSRFEHSNSAIALCTDDDTLFPGPITHFLVLQHAFQESHAKPIMVSLSSMRSRNTNSDLFQTPGVVIAHLMNAAFIEGPVTIDVG